MVPPSGPSTPPGVHEIGFESLVQEIAFESFGVRIGVHADNPRLWPRIAELVPPHSRKCDPSAIDHHFSITTDNGATYTVRYDLRDGIPARLIEGRSWIATDVDLPLAVGLLGTHLHGTVAYQAPDLIFVHGGAVAYRDRMIVMPAPALAGKSTLVAALIRAGGTYYSDQFAVIDHEGRVHPYMTPLRVPGAGRAVAEHNGDHGELADAMPLPIGTIVFTNYRNGAEWRPRLLSRGESLLGLMSQTVAAMDRAEESMRVHHRVLDSDPIAIESERDEAEALASSLLAELESRLSESG